MKTDSTAEKAVKAVLDKFAESYTKQDLKTVLSLIAPDDDVVIYGTSADEKRIRFKEIKTQFERDWTQLEDPAHEYKWFSISTANDVALMAIDSVFKAKSKDRT